MMVCYFKEDNTAPVKKNLCVYVYMYLCFLVLSSSQDSDSTISCFQKGTWYPSLKYILQNTSTC